MSTTPLPPEGVALKPCPFCGEQLRKMSEQQGYWHPIVNCPLSDFHMEADGYSEQRWNTRRATKAEAANARLKEAVEWYEERAKTLSEIDWKNKPTTAVAIFTELSLDGGATPAKHSIRERKGE